MKTVYMDYAATTYVKPEVLEEMLPYFTEKFGNPSSFYGISRETKMAIDKARGQVANALNSMKEVISMYEPIYNDGGDVIYLEDQLNTDMGMYDLETKISLKNALNKLKNKEKYIIVERYLVGKTQMELAEEIGISQAQISRLEKSGLENIKKMIS